MNNEKILERIKKCLALAESSNPNEAAQAVKVAQKLMEKHQIKHFDVMISCQKSDIKLANTLQKHVDLLVRFISSAFGCDVIFHSVYREVEVWSDIYQCYQYRPRYHQCVSFIGTEHAAKISVYVFEHLHRLMNDARKNFMRSLHGNSKKKTKTEKSDAFALGWVMAVGKQLPDMDVSKDVATDKQAYINKHFGELDNVDVRKLDEDKFLHQMVVGYQDGQHVNVHTGVNGKQGDTTSSAALCLPVHNIEDY
ncbi:TPA: DUF2786 domain-containing protein [Vibrio parahaemolyticus]|uniref:DUF2786 domain-containing protein n=1 Tax=Vibrio sp. 99K-1 TaxID=2607603 RepID=UPI0014937794|nr:DUF2786 domain-containing protein [Vibrio sp. 99K-1]NOI88264.1 DUF2786 domain-containing protein [Vibrio sp. 99K-1]